MPDGRSGSMFSVTPVGRTLGWMAGRETKHPSGGCEYLFVAAGPVSRILSTGLLQQDDHSSGPCITERL